MGTTFTFSDAFGQASVGFVFVAVLGGLASVLWDGLKRRRDADATSLASFYETYGEWFAVWKLWETVKDGDYPSSTDPESVRKELLDRAASTEGKFEALLVKIAVERRLRRAERARLGRFREGYQSLREHIETDRELRWNVQSGDAGQVAPYVAFKALAVEFARLLSAPWTRLVPWARPSLHHAAESLLRITSWRHPTRTLLADKKEPPRRDPNSERVWWHEDSEPQVWSAIENTWRALTWLHKPKR